MAADKDFPDVRAHQLENRSSYLVWRRHFERTGKDLRAGMFARASEIDGPRSGLKLQAAYKRWERKREVEHNANVSSWSATRHHLQYFEGSRKLPRLRRDRW